MQSKAMNENELSKIVLDVAFDIHKRLGPEDYLNLFMKQ